MDPREPVEDTRELDPCERGRIKDGLECAFFGLVTGDATPPGTVPMVVLSKSSFSKRRRVRA